jgi:hypothetical protein
MAWPGNTVTSTISGRASTSTLAVSPKDTPPATAEMVLAPGLLERKLPLAIPCSSVTGGCAIILAVPVALSTTSAPDTAFPNASRAATLTTLFSPARTLAGVASIEERDGSTGPGRTSAWNSTEAPGMATALARSVSVPTSVPRVHEVTEAVPSAPVVTVRGTTVPLPLETVKSTLTPATRLPIASRTTTVGAIATVLPASACWPSPASSRSRAATPEATGKAPLSAGGRPSAVAVST